jgi:multiple sugar transport system permease protein
MARKSILSKLGTALLVFVIVSPAILFFVWMLSISLKYEIDNGAYPPILIPERFAWSNYSQIFEANDFLLYFWNSILVTGMATLLAASGGCACGLWHCAAQGA